MKQITKEIKDEPGEVWKTIKDSDGIYAISCYGRVKRAQRVIERKGYPSYVSPARIMETPISGSGYPSFLISLKNKKPRRVRVHRLVAEAFIPNPGYLPQVNHINGIKTDNRAENLEWCTSQHNINHAFNSGLNRRVQQNDPKRSKPVIQLSTNNVPIKEFKSAMDVQRTLGFKASNINKAIKNKILSYGYYWQYK